MSFNSIEFVIYFPVVVSLYFLLPHRVRWLLLLLCSYYFYMCWRPKYVLLIMALTLIDYFAGIMIGRAKVKSKRRKYLLLSLSANLGLLFFFKYFNFFNDTLRSLFRDFNLLYDVPGLNVILPIGISFHTFQTMSYTIEVYRGAREPEKNLGIFALYVAYFPQLVSGPIERPGNLLPQFRQPIAFNYDRITSGLKLMLWGMFKKVVVADNLAILVNRVYTHPTNYQGISLIAATVFFAFQIYCDFSGYTDIAIGAAQVMGHKLMENFKRPYFSKSIGEFWRRWHISLSSWFRDYLYIPLGGNRVSVPRWYFNLFIVFLLSGLWHGANWTFLIWGGLHGFYLISSIAMQPWRAAVAKMVGLERVPTLHKCLQVGVTFALVCFSWIFFRANSLSDAFYIVSHLFSGWNALLDFQKFKYAISMGLGLRNLMLPVLGVAFMEMAHLVQRKGSVRRLMVRTPFWVRWPAYVCLALAIMNLGVPYEIPFIYFQF